MTTTIDDSTVFNSLRDKAEAQLQAGTTPTSGPWSMGVDALQLLHRLSSDPNNAQDALKLLHELQVHQVELDLQNEEIAANEQSLVGDLGLYRGLFDFAPIAYCVVDPCGTIVQANLATARLFGIGQCELEGQRIDSILKPKNRPLLLDLLQRVSQGGASDSCISETADATQGIRHMQFLATLPPGREHILLACCPCADTE